MSGSKSVVFYTDLSENRKRLNLATDIVLTLTPADGDRLPNSANPLAWKVLRFDPNFPVQHSVIWHEEAGFWLAVENEDGTLSARTQSQIVERKHMTSFDEVGSGQAWSNPLKYHDAPTIVAFNNSATPKQFSLCSVDNSQTPPIFSPVYSLGSVAREEKIECLTPMILQAYAVTGYKESQPFKAPDKTHFLLKDHKNDPKPLNMEDASKYTVFRVYSHTSGRPMVEKV
ncbi:hypothetical protein C8F04DRAFT_457831 [Mycena alexandri]|uniref:Uncharacterized protein n=1 Tax=Mycena alexandri TaxID=1745969 RepID=A0AAD6T0M8_9AGAR|nr:hypothetical protein C8F04DRAFT_457831 [Mycena alexandri]